MEGTEQKELESLKRESPAAQKKQNLDDGVSPGDTYSSTGLA
ncbi:hypothetical protein GGP63_000936 [Salinibacter ruber]|nr:hypothetical protein [Salinibacter ruber]